MLVWYIVDVLGLWMCEMATMNRMVREMLWVLCFQMCWCVCVCDESVSMYDAVMNFISVRGQDRGMLVSWDCNPWVTRVAPESK